MGVGLWLVRQYDVATWCSNLETVHMLPILRGVARNPGFGGIKTSRGNLRFQAENPLEVSECRKFRVVPRSPPLCPLASAIQEKRHINTRRILGTLAGCPGDTRRDK